MNANANANANIDNNISVLDFQGIRRERQRHNINNIIECISQSKYKSLTPFINQTELSRVLDETQMDANTLYSHCNENQILLIVLAGRIAKNSTRQGTKDEQLQIDVCNKFANKYNITIENLTTVAFRPTKDGRIVSAETIKSENIPKNLCLKSFDAKISGAINGWLFAKVVFGSGGHQDNVFEEADTLCEWVNHFGVQGDLYVILIDTDLHAKMTALKQKYAGNQNRLFIGNHVELQQYIGKPRSSESFAHQTL